MNLELDFQDKHTGETCVVIGNGPSLKNVSLAFLRKYPTFGTNRIYLPPMDTFTATYYTCINPLVIEQSKAEINAYKAKAKFIAEAHAGGIDGAYGLTSTGAQLFSYNPAAYVYEGFTVTFVCLQLAFFMGFKTVLLVGVDHKYKTDGPPNSETTWQGDDPNHFSPEYFKGTRWNNPDLTRSAQAYQLAEKAFSDNGRRIINLTPESALDVFKKESINKWLK